MNINSICVCGAGTMGSGIAQAAAQAGFSSILFDLNPDVLNTAKKRIEQNLESGVQKGRISREEKDKTFQLIQFTSELNNCIAAIIIEAIVEKEAAKVALFNQLAELNHADCIFASNTSSLSVTAIARQVIHPERVIGMHFFNPATIMKLVEVVSTTFTKPEVRETVTALAVQLHKVPVQCTDSPGFIVNRVARPFYIESLRLAEQGHTTIEQADRLLEATGFRMGPFRLMDLIGNDINYTVSCSVWEQLQQPDRLKPSYLQENLVKEGKLGKKTGAGYYKYE